MQSRPTPQPLSRRDLLKLGGAAVGAFVLRPGESLADGDPPPADAPKPNRGGTFRIRMAQSPAHFDPHQTVAYSTMVPLSFAYSRLVMIKPGSTIVPGTQPIDSDLAPPSTAWQTIGAQHWSVSTRGLDFLDHGYVVEVQLIKHDASGTPGVMGVQLFRDET